MGVAVGDSVSYKQVYTPWWGDNCSSFIIGNVSKEIQLKTNRNKNKVKPINIFENKTNIAKSNSDTVQLIVFYSFVYMSSCSYYTN